MPANPPAEALPDRRTPAPIPDAGATLPAARMTEWKPWAHSPNSSLLGHVTVEFSGGWTVTRIPIFRGSDGALSAGVPSIPELDADGRVRLRPDGTRSYSPIISFTNVDARTRWQRAVLSALAGAGVIP